MHVRAIYANVSSAAHQYGAGDRHLRWLGVHPFAAAAASAHFCLAFRPLAGVQRHTGRMALSHILRSSSRRGCCCCIADRWTHTTIIMFQSSFGAFTLHTHITALKIRDQTYNIWPKRMPAGSPQQRLYRHQVPQNINYVIWTLHHVCVCVQANFSTERWCPFIVPGKRATHASRKMLHAGKLRPFIVAHCCRWILIKFAPAGTLTEKGTVDFFSKLDD